MSNDADHEVAQGVSAVERRRASDKSIGTSTMSSVDDPEPIEFLSASDEALRSGEVIGRGLDGRVGWVGHGNSCDVGCRLVG